MIDMNFIESVIQSVNNKKWKEIFTENEFRSIITSMYQDYQKLKRSDFEFGLYVNAMMFMLNTKDGQDSLREEYLNKRQG